MLGALEVNQQQRYGQKLFTAGKYGRKMNGDVCLYFIELTNIST
jgi:hypothetical protein